MGGGAADEAVVDPAMTVRAEDDEVAGRFPRIFRECILPGAPTAVMAAAAQSWARARLWASRLVFWAIGRSPSRSATVRMTSGRCQGIGQLDGVVQGAAGGGGAIHADEDLADGLENGRGDEAGAAGVADEALHGRAGDVGRGLRVLALAAEHDQLGARLDFGQDLGGMAEFERGDDGDAGVFATGGRLAQEGFAARAQGLLEAVDRSGIPRRCIRSAGR